jgi:plastocyanin
MRSPGLAPVAACGLALGLAAVLAAAAAPASAASPTGTVAGRVTEQVGRSPAQPVAGAVVYLVGVKERGRRPARRQTIQQRDLKFAPAYTVVMKGDVVEFPNNERNAVDHNVFSPREQGTTWFDLGRYGRGESNKYTFHRPGVYDIYCNIHPEMKAQVKVVENRFYATTGASGQFRLADVPAGTYEIRVWRPYAVEESAAVTVAAGAAAAPADLVFRTAAPSAPRRHRRIDGSRYPEY